MSPEPASNKTKICPTCGTRLSENATRCLVCGTEFGARPEPKAARKVERSVQASRMPEITLTLPAAVGALAVVIVIAAVIMYFALGQNGAGASVGGAESSTPTDTPTSTLPSTPTFIPTEVPTS